MDGKQGFNVIAIVLALLLLLAGFWGFRQTSVKNSLQKENDKLTKELSDLNDLKEDLAVEVDSLEDAYQVLSEENATLQNSLDDAASQIARKNAAVKAAERKATTSVSEINNLRAEIQDLLASKDELESSIYELQTENDSLKTLAGVLVKDLSKVRADNEALANLNRSMEEELQKLTLSNFKASAFQVEVERKKPTVTSKARAARRIKVEFDLTDVPGEYHGIRPVYMTITNKDGIPITTDNPIQAKVVVNDQAMDIIAVKSKNVNIAENQRLNFSHDISPKLKAGYYRVTVYTDIGLLGSSTFRLR